MQVIGHRGAAALAPENTWASFDRALDLGVDAIETDVQAASDGVLVLIHDKQLARTTDGQGLVAETPWSELCRLDADSWFDPAYSGARIPRLDDTLQRYGQRVPVVLEIKQPGVEGDVVALVRAHALMEAVTFTSFDFATVVNIRFLAAEAKVGFLTADISVANVTRTVDAGLDQFCPPASAVTADLVSMWRARSLAVRAWGVKDVHLMQRAMAADVDGMTVDFPHLLLAALESRQA